MVSLLCPKFQIKFNLEINVNISDLPIGKSKMATFMTYFKKILQAGLILRCKKVYKFKYYIYYLSTHT